MENRYLSTILPRTIVRREPCPTSEVVAILPMGTKVELRYDSEDGATISFWVPDRGEVIGYVDRQKLDLPKPEPKPVPEYRLPPCNACGALDWVTLASRDAGGLGYEQSVVVPGEKPVPLRVRICRSCGHAQSCVDYDGVQSLNAYLRGCEN